MLLVARSLAVYGATAAALVWLAHRFVRPLERGGAVAIVLTPLLFTGRATLTGGVYAPLDIVYQAEPFGALRGAAGIASVRTPLLSDVVFQEIPWRKAVRAAVKRGELPLWNPYVLAGEPLAAVQQPAVFHPGTWIGFLLPLPQAWTFEMSLRILLALLCAYLFLRDIGCRTVPALLGASGWAFSNYLVFFLGYPLSPAAAPFPLLLLGLRRVAREPGRDAAALVVAALLLIVTSGHPETLLHTVAAAGLYFLFELTRARRGRRRAIRVALTAVALALGVSAVLLLPFAEALPHTLEYFVRSTWYAHRPRAYPWEYVVGRLAVQVSPLAVGILEGPEPAAAAFGPTGYCGALLLPLAFAGLFARCRARWVFAALGLAGLSVAAATPAADALARLPLFGIALNERLIFLTAFSVCALAALGANRLADGEGAPAVLFGSAATLAGLTWLFLSHRSRLAEQGMNPAEARGRFLFQILPVLIGAAAIAALSRERRTDAGTAALLAILLAQRVLEGGSLYPTIPARAFYPPLSVLAPIPRGEPERFTALHYGFIPNAAALYGLEDVRGYEAMTFRPLTDTYPAWCVPQAVWYNRVDDPTTPFLAFLNVRWVLSPAGALPPPGWAVRAEGEGMRLFENPRRLPRAFVPRMVRGEPDPEQRIGLLQSIRDFGERGIVGESGTGDWTRNGDAAVTITGYAAGRLTLDVEAREPALVGTSVTAWPGWKGTLDGRAIPAVSYNHAFLGFRVPAGRHRLVLRYAPASVRAGAAVSLASLVLAVALLLRRDKSGMRENPM